MNARAERVVQTNQRVGFPLWQHIGIFIGACAWIISRRPDALLHPQFWAEDGSIWFADAYNLGGWAALFRTQAGYFQTLPRLASIFGLLAPLSLAPLVFNLIALAAQALPVNVLLGSRSSAWGKLRMRAMLAGVYLALPNCPEICANITNAQWAIALCAFLVLVAAPPASFVRLQFDLLVYLVCGLTGPFCVFFVPIALFLAMRRRVPWRWIPFSVFAVCSGVQAWGLLVVSPSVRSSWGVLGANPALLIRILAGNVYIGALLGTNDLAASPGSKLFFFLLFVALLGTVIVATSFAESGLEMKLFILFACMTLVASLASPTSYAPPGTTKWQQLAGASAVRYWFFPSLAFLWSLLFCLKSRMPALKVISALLLCLLCFGIALKWRRPAFEDTHYSENVRRFEAAPPGTVGVFPLNPEGWSMRLIRRSHP